MTVPTQTTVRPGQGPPRRRLLQSGRGGSWGTEYFPKNACFLRTPIRRAGANAALPLLALLGSYPVVLQLVGRWVQLGHCPDLFSKTNPDQPCRWRLTLPVEGTAAFQIPRGELRMRGPNPAVPLPGKFPLARCPCLTGNRAATRSASCKRARRS
eukprot:scaffold3577_cov414-Prasinococcus_capsulatus_cf.AAC.3